MRHLPGSPSEIQLLAFDAGVASRMDVPGAQRQEQDDYGIPRAVSHYDGAPCLGGKE